ncbi:MAG: DUF3306 domain-containing protein, partial [Limnohabitans sp.]
MSEGFFSRWSRRKREAGQGDDQAPEAAPQLPRHPDAPSAPDQRSAPVPVPGLAAGAVASTGTGAGAGPTPQGSPPPAASLPTLDDVQQLTPESDFQPFMRPGVGSEVRNAAMKKLFADPHFNVMDGLDIYIDDYSLPDPMPAGMLHKMASAQFMK